MQMEVDGDEPPSCSHCGGTGRAEKKRRSSGQAPRSPHGLQLDTIQDPYPSAHHDRGREYARTTTEYDKFYGEELQRRHDEEVIGTAFDDESFRFLALDYASDLLRRIVWPTSVAEESEEPDQRQAQHVNKSPAGITPPLGSGDPSMPEADATSSSFPHDIFGGVTISYDASSTERCLGYPPDTVGSSFQWWEERIHSDDRPRVILSLKRALESGSSKYWSESYRLRIYRGPSSSFPGAMQARHRGSSSASVQTPSAISPTAQRPFVRTTSSYSASSNGSNSPATSALSNRPASISTNRSTTSSTRKQYFHQSDAEDFLTVLDQLYITRDTGSGRLISAMGVIFAAEQRIKVSEALNAPRSRLLRSIPKGGISYMGAEIITTILQNTSSGLFMMDATGYPTYMNQAASDITGYASIDEISNAPLHYAVHYKRPDGSDYPMEECPLDNANAKLVRLQNQTEVFVKKDGTLFPVVWSCAPIERLGKTVGAVIEFRDVTEERKLEQERFQATLTAKHQEIRIKEAEAHRQRISQFVDYIAHELRNPLHGIAANIDFLRDSLEGIQTAIEQRASETPHTMTNSPSLLSSSMLDYSMATSHRRSPSTGNGKAPGSPGVSSLTAAAASESSRLMGHRTSFNDLSKATHNAQFKEPQGHRPVRAESGGSNPKSPSIAPLLSDFTQVIPFDHGLHKQPRQNEPVTSATQLGTLSSAVENELRQALSTSRSFITSIQECVSHATHITNNVLDLSRLEAGKVELLDDLVYPAKVANLAIDMMAARAQEKDIELGLQLPKERTLVRGDGTRLAQVFLNLISNAIKFTPIGGQVTVKFDVVQAPSQEQTRMFLTGSVTDSGVGMSPQEMGNLFQRFGQSSRNIQAEYGGTGLGLSICQEIVTLQGGKMQVDSKKGHGSTFSFTSYYGTVSEEEVEAYLKSMRTSPEARTPISTTPMEVLPSNPEATPTGGVMPQKTNSSQPSHNQLGLYEQTVDTSTEEQVRRESYKFKHVLVAEDNSINQNIMKTYLRKLGYHFTVVANGQEVLDVVVNKPQEIPIDVILMDCEMPVMDGRRATQRVREHESFRKNLVTPLDSPFDLHATAYSIATIAPGNSALPTWHPLGTPSPGTNLPKRRTPIIGLSGNARKELIEEAYAAGMDDYVVKPFKLPDLEKVLKKWESAVDAQLQARAVDESTDGSVAQDVTMDDPKGSSPAASTGSLEHPSRPPLTPDSPAPLSR